MPTRTVLEDVVLNLIVASGLERSDVNVPMTLDGNRVVPDFCMEPVVRVSWEQAVRRPAEIVARLRAAPAWPRR